jgi:DNA invertase Pin-like site-specific DNA recombinase
VSTDEQNLDLQIEALIDAGCDEIMIDRRQSGSKVAETRPGFSEALDLVESGDLLVDWKLDRVGGHR